MTTKQKLVLGSILIMAVVVFALFSLPNSVATKNMAMILMFQPDESTPLPYLFRMIAPADNLIQGLKDFVRYEYYYYGFPYFSLSAVLLLPLQWIGQITNLPLVILILRQFVSILPMLAALLLLVYMQDGFRTYRSIVLFAILLCVPAVIQNNLWWHPDGLTVLFVVLTIFFLQRDDLHFGRNFLLAAVMCGIATATKLVGVYFFLAVSLPLILGLILKKASWKKIVGMAAAFLLVMAFAFLFANPFLFSPLARKGYGYILHKQTFLLAEGYGIVYEKGLAAAWPLMHQSYGEAIFLLVALGVAIWRAWRGPQRLLHGLILAWFLPMTIVILFITHFKFQYWLPAALPLFSGLIVLLPEKWSLTWSDFKSGIGNMATKLAPILLLLVVLIQVALFVNQDAEIFTSSLHRADNNPQIQFYDNSLNALAPLPDGTLYVYFDYRLYVPETTGWTTTTTFDLLEYSYIQNNNFDVLLLLEQRIKKYLNPDATGIDPEVFARNQQFYRDADNGTIDGYYLVYRNDVGVVYVREDLYQKWFQK